LPAVQTQKTIILLLLEDRTLTTRVVIVRHGQSSYNTEQRIQGRSDASIDGKGGNDARKVGAALSRLNLAAIYTSPLADQTISRDHRLFGHFNSDILMEIVPVGSAGCFWTTVA